MRIVRVHPRPLVLALPALLCLLTAEASSASRAQARGDPPIGGRALSPASAWPLDVQLEFRAATFGGRIGEAGLHAADLDGDGLPEIVTAAYAGGVSWAPAQFWYVLSRRGASYRQTFVSPELRDGITSLAVAPVDADAAPEILVATGSRIQVYDGATRELQWTIDTAASRIVSLQAADVDADGAVEVAFCSPEGLYVHDAVTGAEELGAALDECVALAVGQVDGDASLELVLGNGTDTGYVLDGVTRTVQWSYPLGFGRMLRLGDLDGDSVPEIVAADWDRISILDAVARVEEDAVYPWFSGVDAVEVADVEGDGPLELVWAADQWGSVHVLDGATRVEKWEVDNPGHGVTNLVVTNTDEDAARELWWGASPGLYAVDAATRDVEWRNLSFGGPFYGLAHGDVDADGRPDFLFTSLTSDVGTFEEGLYFVYGAVNKRLRYFSGTTGGNWDGLWRVQVANVDADPQLEILLGARDSLSHLVVCYDGLTREEQWRAPLDDHVRVTSLQVGDVDADGQLEAVVGTNGSFVYVLDAATGAREWRSPSIPGGWSLSLLRLAQLDGDPALEILVAQYGGRLLSFDGVTHTVSQLVEDGVTALAATDRNGDGRAEVLVGTEDGELRVVHPARRRGDRVIGRFGARIDGLAVADLDGDGIADYAFASDGTVRIVAGLTRATLWESGWVGSDAGADDSLLLADIDWDGRLELMVNIGHVGVDIYDVPTPP